MVCTLKKGVVYGLHLFVWGLFYKRLYSKNIKHNKNIRHSKT